MVCLLQIEYELLLQVENSFSVFRVREKWSVRYTQSHSASRDVLNWSLVHCEVTLLITILLRYFRNDLKCTVT